MRRRTSQSLGDILQGGSGVVPQQHVDGHHHPRRAEAALGAVDLGDPLLHTGRLEVRWRVLLLAEAPPPQPSHLHWVDPGPGAADALHRGHSSSLELADGQQTGVGGGMSDTD